MFNLVALAVCFVEKNYLCRLVNKQLHFFNILGMEFKCTHYKTLY